VGVGSRNHCGSRAQSCKGPATRGATEDLSRKVFLPKCVPGLLLLANQQRSMDRSAAIRRTLFGSETLPSDPLKGRRAHRAASQGAEEHHTGLSRLSL
jgi:hypothetical protein